MGHTVRKPVAAVSTAVTVNATAVAPIGTLHSPVTCTMSVWAVPSGDAVSRVSTSRHGSTAT